MSHFEQPAPFGLYIHVPFCARKCPYCDFNTYAGLGSLFDRTVDALCAELAMRAEHVPGRVVTSVFVGGGTPTVLSAGQLTRLLQTVRQEYGLSPQCEITVEANPGTVDREKFHLLHGLGVTRLSLGVQSFQPDELAFLGRIHSAEDVFSAYDTARAAGFDNINLDFIFGLPDQGRESWLDTLAKATALEPEHLSLYSLIVEPDTPLFQWVESGRVQSPDEDRAADLYELALEHLGVAGYSHYEISNWARASDGETPPPMPQLACRHNLLYWLNGEYIGVGPGAHSHLRRSAAGGAVSRRWSNCRPVPEYARRIEGRTSAEDFSEELSPRESMAETMLLGLRLVRQGVSHRHFADLHGLSLLEVFGTELQELQAQGLIVVDSTRAYLTPRGIMLGNQVFATFLPDTSEVAYT